MDNPNTIESQDTNDNSETGSTVESSEQNQVKFDVQLSQDEYNAYLAKQKQKGENKIRTEFADLIDNADVLREYMNRKESSESPDKKTQRDLEAAQAQIQSLLAEKEAGKAEMANTLFDGQIDSLAEKHHLAEVDIVKDLLRKQVAVNYDEKVIDIVDAEGTRRFKDGRPMGLEDLLIEFKDQRPAFVKSPAKGGGTSSNITPPPGQSSGSSQSGSVYKNNRPK